MSTEFGVTDVVKDQNINQKEKAHTLRNYCEEARLLYGEAWCLTVQSDGVAGVDDQEMRVMASTQMPIFSFFASVRCHSSS